MKKILIACDKFKGSLSAYEVNEAVRRGMSRSIEGAEFVNCIIADGGEGFVQALVDAADGEMCCTVVEDALGRAVEAEWGLIPDGGGKAAVIEMSAASGLWRIAEEERDIMRASTYGTGQLIQAARSHPEVQRIYIGLGGSATNDGGAGMAQALGAKFYDAQGAEITARMCPALLPTVARVVLPEPSAHVVTVACDVDSPLCGPLGASAVFGPQKGATPELVATLDTILGAFAQLCAREDLSTVPGAGAAGGMGFGLMTFAQAELVSGFDLVAQAVGLQEQIATADLVVTGEGKLDSQSLAGKGPIGVAQLAQAAGKPCLAVAGGMDADVAWSDYFQDYASLSQTGLPLSELMTNAETYLVEIATQLAGRV